MTEPLIITDEGGFTQILGAAQQPTCWVYVRVSSKKQEWEGLSLEGQRQAALDYCAAAKLPVPVIVQEVGSATKPLLAVTLPGQSAAESGGDGLAARPLFAAMMAILTEQNRGPRHFVVWKLDRFSRGGSEQELLLRMLWRADVTVHSTQPNEQEILKGDADPARVLLRQIFAAFAQYEKALIQMRMDLGRRAKAARGGWIAGCAPYGYDNHRKDLVVNPAQARLVAAVFYLQQQGYSYRAIARAMPTRFGATDNWGSSKVGRIVANRTAYTGTLIDRYGHQHARPDLRILPDDWDVWAQENDPQYVQPAVLP